MPGLVYYRGTRKLVLKGVDGIVFVADSQIHRLHDNVEAINDLYQDLIDLGFNTSEIPLILQCNKRDLQEIMPVLTIKETLGLNGILAFESVALEGTGVLDSLKSIINSVVANARGTINQNPG